VLSEKKILNETKNHNPPLQVKWSVPKLNHSEGLILDNEISKLMLKGVVEYASHSDREFISTVFLRPKKRWRS
jgi:hypothetical protein